MVWQRGLPCKFLMRKVSKKSPLNQVQPLTPLKAGDNTLKYQLRYKSTKAGATGGNATAVLYLIWFTSEGVMLKRIIWILFLLGLTGGCELFAHDGTVNISGSFRP
ncbi:fimbrial-like adhesin protein [Escherichia coli]|uniref:Fimbrial-like adhesin protein n=1 Tax=Escherichia coli TaxID=562 RepID=A0A376UDD3_ECOLX|nr:fimbrial-like adhesin protein [Escherichia coli]